MPQASPATGLMPSVAGGWLLLALVAAAILAGAGLASVLYVRLSRLAEAQRRERREAERVEARRMDLLRADIAAAFEARDAQVAALEARLDRLARDAATRAEAAQAQIRATLEAGDRQIAASRDRLHALEEAASGQTETARARIAALLDDASRQIAASREQLRAIEETASRRLTAIRAELSAAREASGAGAGAEGRPDAGGRDLSGAQVRALNALYWDMDALDGDIQRALATLPADAGAPAPTGIALIRVPVTAAEADPAVEVLGPRIALGVRDIGRAQEDLLAGPDLTAGEARDRLTVLAAKVRGLVALLETLTAAHAATDGMGR